MAFISVKEAVKSAKAFMLEAIDAPQAIQVEEVELDNAGGEWFITLSFLGDFDATTIHDALNPLARFAAKRERVYKLFRIDATTAKVKSMKIRSVE